MTEYSNKPSYHDILNELTILKMKNSNLNNEIRRLKKNIQKIQDNQGLQICEYFDMCNSIRDTSDKFCFEAVDDCYEALKDYFGGSDHIQEATDYIDCYKEIFGREYEYQDSKEEEELAGEKNIENLTIENLDEN